MENENSELNEILSCLKLKNKICELYGKDGFSFLIIIIAQTKENWETILEYLNNVEEIPTENDLILYAYNLNV